MKNILQWFSIAAMAAALTACQTSSPALKAPVPQVALATSLHRDVFNLDRPVVTEFAASDVIAISIHIPRGGGYGEREGTIIVRNVSDARIVRREKLRLKEDDYLSLKQDNPGPGKYNVELIADNGVLGTTWFEVR